MRRASLSLVSLGIFSLGACSHPAQVATPAPAPRAAPPALSTPVLDSPALRPGRFDAGKMWTFDHPPLDYFQEAYGFRPDSAWLSHARLGALRFATYCSASFVSSRGLVLTNHHCSRENTGTVLRPGENFDSTGFYAATEADERRVPGLFVEQLLSITDVTTEIDGALRGVTGDQTIAQARQQAIDALEQGLGAAARDSTIRVQVVSLYQGAEYSAYTYRRYSDVRLVFVPELAMGYFGGDDDNFTYPRYDLDFSIYRVYDGSGRPLTTSDYFRMSGAGASAGDAVFVVGNPGSTSRLETMAQLAYARDVRSPAIVGILKSRIAALEAFEREEPAVAAARRTRTQVFGYANSVKAEEGQLAGLRDPVLFGRRAAGEAAFRAELARRPTMAARAALIDSIAEVAREVTAIGPRIYGFIQSPELGSATLGRAALLVRYASAKAAGAPAAQLDRLRQAAAEIPNKPLVLERRLVAAQLGDLVRGLGVADTLVVAVLAGRTTDAAAADLLAHTRLTDSAHVEEILADDLSSSNDAALAYVRRVTPVTTPFRDRARALSARADNLATRLGRARFDVYGRTLPPDATFTLRLADGRVAGYPYNGTRAPPFTTFYGMYERYAAVGGQAPWSLPMRWRRPPAGLDLGTPLDLVSTNDIIGGNSGSPLLNRNLEVVGLIFDGNIESLPGEFIYTDERARSLSVDARGILAALRAPYGAARIVAELGGR
jgi:peptidase S46-like protein